MFIDSLIVKVGPGEAGEKYFGLKKDVRKRYRFG